MENALSARLFFGSILALQTNWLQRADFLVRCAVFPGGLIAGGVVFLVNGCVEHYADFLPPKYRTRRSTQPEWETARAANGQYQSRTFGRVGPISSFFDPQGKK